MIENPEIIILDEPSEGLAPVIVDQLAGTIQTLKTVLMEPSKGTRILRYLPKRAISISYHDDSFARIVIKTNDLKIRLNREHSFR